MAVNATAVVIGETVVSALHATTHQPIKSKVRPTAKPMPL
jgi:hypothetical protein